MKKIILITGSSGFCGSYLSNYFKKKSNEYVVYTMSRTKSTNLTHIVHDMLNPLPLDKFPNDLGIIIHCASEVIPNNMNYSIVENNLRMNYNLLQFTLKLKISNFINLSSISVYGTQNTSIVNENFETKPNSLYGISKIFSENLCNFLLSDQIKLVNLRLGYVLGKNFPKRYFLTKIKNAILNDTSITLLNPDNTKFTFIDLSDISKICEKSLETNIHGTFNIVNDDFPSVRDVFLEMLLHLPSKHISLKEKIEKKYESHTRISNTKIKKQLGIKFSSYKNSFKNMLN